MATPMSEEEIYKKARKRVEEKKGFYVHLAIYIVVNAMLILIWAFTDHGEGVPWFVWTLGGWGIGIIFHGLSVFVFGRETGWERTEVEKEADRIRKSGKQ
jgi:2TM domain